MAISRLSPADAPARTVSRRGGIGGFDFTDVREGEGRRVFGASLILGGIVAAHVLLETARDAIFLVKLGPADLGFVYLAMAALGAVVAHTDQMVARLLGRRNALALGLMVASIGTMSFYSGAVGPARAFALYLWAGVVTTLLTVQFWLAVGMRFSPAQGRRLFGLISGGGVLGAVLGAGLGALLADAFPVQSLLAASAALHLVTAFLVTAAPPGTPHTRGPHPALVREGMAKVVADSYLIRLGLLLQVAAATLLVVDYAFKTVMASRYPAELLAVHLARYYALQNAASLLVQVFLTMRILQRAGTVASLLLLPLLLVASGAFGLAYGTALLFVLFAKGADGGLRYSLHRAASELLFLPLDPDERSRIKPFFDSVLGRATQALVAFGLLIGTRMGLLGERALVFLTIGLSLLWMALAWSLRKPYLERFRSALVRSSLRGFRPVTINLDSLPVLVEALSSPDEARVVSAMNLLSEGKRENLIPALVLYHPSPRVLVTGLDAIANESRSDWVPLAERLLRHEDDSVRIAAVRALGGSGHVDSILRAGALEYPNLRATAAFFVAAGQERPEEQPALAEFLQPDAEPSGVLALLDAIARFGGPSFSEAVVRVAEAKRPEADQLLPLAMARTGDTRFIPELVLRLGRRSGRVEVHEALRQFGEPALDALEAVLHDAHALEGVRLQVPRAIAAFESERAGEVLLESLGRPIPGAVRYKSLRALGKLSAQGFVRVREADVLPLLEKNLRECVRFELFLGVLESHDRAPSLSASLYYGLLEDKQRQALERSLRLLQLLHPREDLRKVYHVLQGDDARSRAAAAEILEVVSLPYDEEVRGFLRLSTEPRSERSRLIERHAAALGVAVPLQREVVEASMLDEDPVLSALAASYADELEDPRLEPLVERSSAMGAWLRDASWSPSR